MQDFEEMFLEAFLKIPDENILQNKEIFDKIIKYFTGKLWSWRRTQAAEGSGFEIR